MKKPLNFIFILLSFLVIYSLFSDFLFAGDTTRVSFMQQNKKHYFTTFSFGMGVDYSNNPSLKKYIQYKIPDYSTLGPSNQLSDFASGLEFFGGIERQISKNFSLKAEYSYFMKSYNVAVRPDYDFSYINHQPFLMLNYIIPQEYFYIKIGAGAGYILSELTVKEFGGENSYTSTGAGLKCEGVLNAQISKNVAGYLSGFIAGSIMGSLKNNNGNLLIHPLTENENVNLSSFGVGLRLGVEIYIF